jgi:hypothetical protein
MNILWAVLALAFVLALAIALRGRGSLGKRLRLEGGNLYYTDRVTTDEADRVGQYLVRHGFYKAGLIDARLARDGAVYQIQLVTPLAHPQEEQYAGCEVLAAGLSDDVLAGAGVEVHVCDRVFRPNLVVPHRRRFGRRVAMNAASLFYLEGVTQAEAENVALFLAHAGLFNDSSKVAQINRAGAGYEFRLAVVVEPLTSEMVEGARQMASDLSRHVLGGLPVDVRYCKGRVATLRTVEPGSGAQAADKRESPAGPYRTEFFVPREMPGDNNRRDSAT